MKKATLITLEALACFAVACLFWWALLASVASAQICEPGQILICETIGDTTYCYCV